jgi:hypothetical protein
VQEATAANRAPLVKVERFFFLIKLLLHLLVHGSIQFGVREQAV